MRNPHGNTSDGSSRLWVMAHSWDCQIEERACPDREAAILEARNCLKKHYKDEDEDNLKEANDSLGDPANKGDVSISLSGGDIRITQIEVAASRRPKAGRKPRATIPCEAPAPPNPPKAAWVASMQERDGEMTDEADIALFTTKAAGLKYLADGCRARDHTLPDDDKEALDLYFDRNSGIWDVREMPIHTEAGHAC